MSVWQTLKSTIAFQTGYFRLRVDECKLPDGRIMPRYHVIEFPDWVNVVPITRDGQMILVRQHRHAVEADFLEIPGGSTDPHHKEDPRAGGERELLEETGYRSTEWVSCGFHYPNPALQSNRLHVFAAFDCEYVQAPHLDPFEDLTVELHPVADVLRRWHAGEFQHALIAASIARALPVLAARGYKL